MLPSLLFSKVPSTYPTFHILNIVHVLHTTSNTNSNTMSENISAAQMLLLEAKEWQISVADQELAVLRAQLTEKKKELNEPSGDWEGMVRDYNKVILNKVRNRRRT
jgi:hypothetical protein